MRREGAGRVRVPCVPIRGRLSFSLGSFTGRYRCVSPARTEGTLRRTVLRRGINLQALSALLRGAAGLSAWGGRPISKTFRQASSAGGSVGHRTGRWKPQVGRSPWGTATTFWSPVVGVSPSGVGAVEQAKVPTHSTPSAYQATPQQGHLQVQHK